MFRNVIAGVDGRSGGRDATALARQLVGPGGTLLLAHVCRDGEGAFEHESAGLLGRDSGRRRVRRRFASTAAPSVASGLHRLVEEHDGDLLVIGSCRRGLAGRVLLGDDTRASLHDLSCAAAIAPRGYANANTPIGVIGVGYDGTIHGEGTVALARGLAADLGASVRALMVLGVPPAAYAQPASLGYSQAAPFAANETGDVLLQRAEREMAALDGVEGLVGCGPPGQELAALSDSVDLLVLGSSRKSRLRRLVLGSATTHLVRASHCPLLLLSRTHPGSACEEQLAGAVTDSQATDPQAR